MPAYKDNKGNWYVQFRYKDCMGKTKSTTKRGFRTKKEALEYERRYLDKSMCSLSMKLVDFVEVYFSDKKMELKSRTINNKRYMINKYIIPQLGEKEVNKISTADIVNWQKTISELGLSETYQRMLNNQIVALFTHATKVYELPKNPCKKISKIGKADARHIDYWTKEEFNQFIVSFDSKDKYIVLFDLLFWTGLRIGEALACTPQDFDFENRTVSVAKTFYRMEGKDIITTPKTEGSVREVLLPDFLNDEIKKYIERLYKYPKDQRIFPVTVRAVEAVMSRHIEKSGLRKIRLHDLRHSHASLLINNGFQPKAIAERLGHADVRMTLNKYSHLYPSEQQRLAQKLNELKNKNDI